MDLDHVVGGIAPYEIPSKQPQRVKQSKRQERLTLSEWLKRGRSPTTRYSDDHGYLYSAKTRREAGEPDLAITFDTEGSNISALDQKTLGVSEYTEVFEPTSNVITRVEYDPKRYLLRVSFVVNGDVVVYGRVPPSVYARLLLEHNRGGSVGAAFWNLVRVEYRGALEMPTSHEDAASRDKAFYRPKRSGFKRRGSKFGRVYQEGGHASPGGYSQPRGPRGPYGMRPETQAKLAQLEKELQSVIDSFGEGTPLAADNRDIVVATINRKLKNMGQQALVDRFNKRLASAEVLGRITVDKVVKDVIADFIAAETGQSTIDKKSLGDGMSVKTFSDTGYSGRVTEGGEVTREGWLHAIEEAQQRGASESELRRLWDNYSKAKH